MKADKPNSAHVQRVSSPSSLENSFGFGELLRVWRIPLSLENSFEFGGMNPHRRRAVAMREGAAEVLVGRICAAAPLSRVQAEVSETDRLRDRADAPPRSLELVQSSSKPVQVPP